MRSLLALVLVLTPAGVWGSFCGESAVPFSFEVLPNGNPVLGCTRPTCFGWTLDGTPVGTNGAFFRVNQHADGFFRRASAPPALTQTDGMAQFQPQVAKCDAVAESARCDGPNQWVGGVHPIANVTHHNLTLQCCSYDPLILAEDRGVASVTSGQIVVGGDVTKNDRQFAFDYIADVVKYFNRNNQLFYNVTVRRFPCVPRPKELSVIVGPAVESEMERRFGGLQPVSTKKTENAVTNSSVAFQAPIFTPQSAGQIPPPPGAPGNIQGPFVSGTEADATQFAQGQAVGQQPAAPVQNYAPVQPQSVLQTPPTQNAYYPVQQTCQASGGDGGFMGTLNNMMCGLFCYTGDTLVSLPDGSRKRMDALQLGDWVLGGNEEGVGYTSVQSWIHRMPNTMADFLHFRLKDGTQLKITGKHYLFRGDCNAVGEFVSEAALNRERVFAEELTPTDCLFVSVDDRFFKEVEIESISAVREQGIYAPMTESGNIVANGVYTSCFTLVNNQAVQLSFSQNLKNLAESALSWFSSQERQVTDASEIELMPGMSTLVTLLHHFVPHKA